jgi:hypothetical protein
MASGCWCHHCPVAVALDDSCCTPVFTCRDIPEPPACRHTARGFTDGFKNTIQDRPHCLVRHFFLGLVAVCCHVLFSGIPQGKSATEGRIISEEGPFSPVCVPVLPERRTRRRKRSGDPSSWRWSVNSGTSVWLPAYNRGTHTLIILSAGAAHIIIKYARC